MTRPCPLHNQVRIEASLTTQLALNLSIVVWSKPRSGGGVRASSYDGCARNRLDADQGAGRRAPSAFRCPVFETSRLSTSMVPAQRVAKMSASGETLDLQRRKVRSVVADSAGIEEAVGPHEPRAPYGEVLKRP